MPRPPYVVVFAKRTTMVRGDATGDWTTVVLEWGDYPLVVVELDDTGVLATVRDISNIRGVREFKCSVTLLKEVEEETMKVYNPQTGQWEDMTVIEIIDIATNDNDQKKKDDEDKDKEKKK